MLDWNEGKRAWPGHCGNEPAATPQLSLAEASSAAAGGASRGLR